MKKTAFLVTGVLFTAQVWAADTMKFNFVNEEIPKILETYSKESGQKLVVDSTVRGKVTILNPSEVTHTEAFNQLSEALSVNGFTFVKQGDFLTVRNARSAQRDNLQVVTEAPEAHPQRMVTWVVTLKNISAESIQKDIRLLTSSYGEMSASHETNKLLITDWTSNLQRISAVIKQIDKPVDASTAKIVAAQKKEWKERQAPLPKKGEKGQQPPPPADF